MPGRGADRPRSGSCVSPKPGATWRSEVAIRRGNGHGPGTVGGGCCCLICRWIGRTCAGGCIEPCAVCDSVSCRAVSGSALMEWRNWVKALLASRLIRRVFCCSKEGQPAARPMLNLWPEHGTSRRSTNVMNGTSRSWPRRPNSNPERSHAGHRPALGCRANAPPGATPSRWIRSCPPPSCPRTIADGRRGAPNGGSSPG